MQVDGAPRVPSRVDRRESREALVVRELVAAEELFSPRVEAHCPVLECGVLTRRIALPHIHHRALERSARATTDL